jgi:group I intron endonuclease
MPDKITIYLIFCFSTNKYYIGQTIKSTHKRWLKHLCDAKNGCDFHFHKAIRKYGKEVFKVDELASVYSYDEANNLETLWISFLKANNSEFGYNLTTGGRSGYRPKCHKHSEQTKEKLKQKTLEHWSNVEFKETQSVNIIKGLAKKYPDGRILSEKHKENLSKSHLGKIFSEEHKANISKSKRIRLTYVN